MCVCGGGGVGGGGKTSDSGINSDRSNDLLSSKYHSLIIHTLDYIRDQL